MPHSTHFKSGRAKKHASSLPFETPYKNTTVEPKQDKIRGEVLWAFKRDTFTAWLKVCSEASPSPAHLSERGAKLFCCSGPKPIDRLTQLRCYSQRQKTKWCIVQTQPSGLSVLGRKQTLWLLRAIFFFSFLFLSFFVEWLMWVTGIYKIVLSKHCLHL